MESLEAMIKCGHCGNMGYCKVRASYRYYILMEDDVYEERVWFLFQCPVCSKPVLAEYTINNSEESGTIPQGLREEAPFISGTIGEPVFPGLLTDFSNNCKILYPSEEKKFETYMLPNKVSTAYEAALRVRTIDRNAFAVMAGRTLEFVCLHENAKGKVLADKIKSLANSGRIPQTLADMAKQIRLLRNLAAHADGTNYEIKEDDVPIIREFVDAILEYLYVAPSKIEHLQNKIDGKYDLLGELDEHPF